MRDLRLRDADDLERALGAPRFLLFKHSPICPTSTRAWAEVAAFLGEHPDIECGWVDVLAERPLARAVAARTGVTHESPQVLLLTEGRAIWNASHSRITRRRLRKHVDGTGGPVNPSTRRDTPSPG